jgi:hypothetical protein
VGNEMELVKTHCYVTQVSDKGRTKGRRRVTTGEGQRTQRSLTAAEHCEHPPKDGTVVTQPASPAVRGERESMRPSKNGVAVCVDFLTHPRLLDGAARPMMTFSVPVGANVTPITWFPSVPPSDRVAPFVLPLTLLSVPASVSAAAPWVIWDHLTVSPAFWPGFEWPLLHDAATQPATMET